MGNHKATVKAGFLNLSSLSNSRAISAIPSEYTPHFSKKAGVRGKATPNPCHGGNDFFVNKVKIVNLIPGPSFFRGWNSSTNSTGRWSKIVELP